MASLALTFLGILQLITVYAKPNIIMMFGDDVGYNDVQFTSLDIAEPSSYTDTTNLNYLATHGVVLSNYYVHRMCSPTRGAFMSGRFAFRLGLQTSLLTPDIAVSLTRQVSIISEEFKNNGYATHAIGKWHLGFQSYEYTPTYRGFDSFYGYWNAFADYYTSTYDVVFEGTTYEYQDCRDGVAEVDLTGNEADYSSWRFRDRAIGIIEDHALLVESGDDTPFFMYLAWQASHTPSEAPAEYVRKYEALDQNAAPTSARCNNQAQTQTMDESIGDIIQTLKDRDLWDNTLIIWSSDNGGVATVGDNFPLRGYKKTIFEGGIRAPAVVSGGYLENNRRGTIIGSSSVFFHVTDWYPTLLDAAGITISYTTSKEKIISDMTPAWESSTEYVIPLDGESIWSVIQENIIPDVLYDRLIPLDIFTAGDGNNGTVRWGKWKYLKGLGTLDDYDGDDGYLWGQEFADIDSTTDGHLWGKKFSNTDVDNGLGCNIDELPINVMCFYTEKGCLFNLDEDPCEYIDRAGDEPEIFNKLATYLQELTDTMPTDVANDDAFSLIDTLEDGGANWFLPDNDGDFWEPYISYEDAAFEKVLLEDYNRIYGDSSSSSSSEEEKENLFNVNNINKLDGDLRILNTKFYLLIGCIATIIGIIILYKIKNCLFKDYNNNNKINISKSHNYGSLSSSI